MLGPPQIPATRLCNVPIDPFPRDGGADEQIDDAHVREDVRCALSDVAWPIPWPATAESSAAEAWLNGQETEMKEAADGHLHGQSLQGRLALLGTSPYGQASYAPLPIEGTAAAAPLAGLQKVSNTNKAPGMTPLQPAETSWTLGPLKLEVYPDTSSVAVHEQLMMNSAVRDDLAAQKRINKELLEASKESGPFKLLEVVSQYLHELNGVNLSTAVHRIARSCQGSTKAIEQIRNAEVFSRMLDYSEIMVQWEIENADGSMPVNCASILGWSCACLRVFRPGLFKALANIGARSLRKCQTYEVTNMLWAFAELCKHQPKLAIILEEDLRRLSVSASEVIMRRGRGSWKIQVLISALASWSTFPTQVKLMEEVFTDLVQELADRSAELEQENTLPIAMAFEILRAEYRTVYDDLSESMQTRFPDFGSKFVFGKKKRSVRRRKQPQWVSTNDAAADNA